MNDFVVSWNAPIIPSQELAGIPLGVDVRDFETVLKKYVLDCAKDLYQFIGSPVLRIEKSIDLKGDGGYGFYIVDLDLTNWSLYFDSPNNVGVETRALHVLTRNWEIYAVKVWMYECIADGNKPENSYQGKLPEGIGLGDLVCELLPYTELEFDSAEEWFYTGEEYGGLEVSGYSGDLSERPDQRITALTVI